MEILIMMIKKMYMYSHTLTSPGATIIRARTPLVGDLSSGRNSFC